MATAPGVSPGDGDRFGHNIGNDTSWLQVRKTLRAESARQMRPSSPASASARVLRREPLRDGRPVAFGPFAALLLRRTTLVATKDHEFNHRPAQHHRRADKQFHQPQP